MARHLEFSLQRWQEWFTAIAAVQRSTSCDRPWSLGWATGAAILALGTGWALPGQAFTAQGTSSATPAVPLTMRQFPSFPAAAPTDPGNTPRELDFRAPGLSYRNTNLTTAQAVDSYIVYVNGSSQSLLDQIRRIEPTAFRSQVNGQPVIQVGKFVNRFKAEDLVRLMQSQGFNSQLALLPAARATQPAQPDLANSPATAAPATPAASAPRTTAATNASPEPATLQGYANAYFVVVPGRGQDLQGLANDLIRVGAPATGVFTRQEPIGPHVAVGPFATRGMAERWSGFFNNNGFDARVYFGK